MRLLNKKPEAAGEAMDYLLPSCALQAMNNYVF